MTDRPIMEVDRAAFAIVSVVAEAHGVAPRVILSNNRQARTVELRRKAIYLMRVMLELSLVEIGRALGGLDHSSVRHAIAQAERRYETDPLYANELDALRARAASTVSDLFAQPRDEGEVRQGIDPVVVAKLVMKAPRGEVCVSGAEIRVLAEAYVDLLLGRMEAAQ